MNNVINKHSLEKNLSLKSTLPGNMSVQMSAVIKNKIDFHKSQ